MTMLPLAVVMLCLMAGAAFAQSTSSLSLDGFDADGDGLLSEAEFQEGFAESGILEAWDSDRDGVLSNDEFSGNLLPRFDADRDDALNEAEFASLAETWLTEDDAPAGFGDWDADRNGGLDAEEFRSGLREQGGLFDTLDGDDDRLLNGEELAAGLFTSWDTNADERLEPDEFTAGVEGLR